MSLVPPSMRSHFTKFGNVKRKYAPAAAQRAAERYHQRPYLCPDCGFWHLATPTPASKTNKAKR